MTDVAPPDTTEWWDVVETTANCLVQLRLEGGDIDEDRLADLVPVAGLMICNKIDSEEPIVVTAALQAGLEAKVLELYGRQGGVSVPSGFPAFGVPRDALDVSYGLVGPSKRRMGVA